MFAENKMDLGEIPAYLLELTQVEEMIIARSHMQIMLHRYHQYFYSGHYVSFMQNAVKTVDMLSNLLFGLDVVVFVVLQPSNQVREGE